MAQQTMPHPTLEKASIIIKKKERKLELYDGAKLVKTYPIGLGFAPVGDKEIEGDGKTPEGDFYLFVKNPESKYHLSLGVSYPSSDDAGRGLEQKLISQSEHDEIVKSINKKGMPLQKTKLGGEIYIHGGGSSSDWTDGCIGLTDSDITEIFNAVPVGITIRILP